MADAIAPLTIPLATSRIHRALSRPSHLMGADRELVLITGLATVKGMASGIGAAGSAVASASRDKAIGVPGTWGASTLGLANAKLDQSQNRSSSSPNRDEKA